MRRRVDALTLDAQTAQWLVDALATAPVPGASELAAAVGELMAGETDSIMLEVGEVLAAASDSLAERDLTRGDLSLLPRSRRVFRAGEEIVLTPKEFDILHVLAATPGEVFTKERIYRAVWKDEYLLGESNIMAFIRKLRKKIEPEPDRPRYILTVWGVGYKFNEDL